MTQGGVGESVWVECLLFGETLDDRFGCVYFGVVGCACGATGVQREECQRDEK